MLRFLYLYHVHQQSLGVRLCNVPLKCVCAGAHTHPHTPTPPTHTHTHEYSRLSKIHWQFGMIVILMLVLSNSRLINHKACSFAKCIQLVNSWGNLDGLIMTLPVAWQWYAL